MTKYFIDRINSKKGLVQGIVIIIFIYVVISFASNEFILTEETYYRYFEEKIEPNRIHDVTQRVLKFNVLKAIWEPVSHLLNVLGTSICLYLGCLYYNESVSFDKLVRVTLWSYLIFVIPALVKFVYFVIAEDVAIEEFNNYSFGSLIFLLSSGDPFWLSSLLQVFTFFEISYWVLLGFGLSKVLTWDFDDSLRLVLSSYFVGLVFWVVARIYIKMMLFNVN